MKSTTSIELTVEHEKAVENRLRRGAALAGLMLVKSRSRDPLADDFGL